LPNLQNLKRILRRLGINLKYLLHLRKLSMRYVLKSY